MAAARFEQRRRAGRPLAGTGLTVFPINETSDRMGQASSLGIQLSADRPSDDVGHAAPEVDHPQGIGPADAELAVDLVQRAWRLRIADRSDSLLAPPHTCQAHGCHQPFHRALGDHHAFAPQLVPDLARAVEPKAGFMDALDLCPHLVIAPSTGRTLVRIGKASSVLVIGGRGDRQFTADRLDTQVLAMGVDERHHHLPWRSSGLHRTTG